MLIAMKLFKLNNFSNWPHCIRGISDYIQEPFLVIIIFSMKQIIERVTEILDPF